MLLKGVLITKLLNNPFASFSFKNLDFLLLYIPHFDDSIVPPFLVFNAFGSTFSVVFFALQTMCQHVL